MAFRFHVIDRGDGFKKLRKLPGGTVLVGLVGARAEETHSMASDHSSVVEIGLHHEFGTERLPERSYIRKTLDDNAGKYRALVVELAALILEETMTPKEALDILGSTVAADMKQTILNILQPPVTPETEKRRGSGPPLLVTREILGAIGYKIILDTQSGNSRTVYPEV